MVVESYIVYVFCTNIELFRDGHYLCRRRGWEKNWGGARLFLISKEGSYCYFLVQR